MTTNRQVIKARDIQNFFGKKERQSFKMMNEMRKHFAKKPFQPITISNFCEYYNVKPQEISEAMQATDEFENQNACNRKAKSSLRHQNPETIATSNNNQYSKPENPNTYIFSKKIW
jgi:hypothetical protein